MAQILEFDPATDLQLIGEPFTFEEEVERAENVRFFTLDEQVTDFFERRVPSTRTTRFQLEVLRRDADRMRMLYNEVILATDTDYQVMKERKPAGYLPWIQPVTPPPRYRPIVWTADYKPVFAAGQPNYYNRLIAALPRPLVPPTEGARAHIDRPQHFHESDPEKPRVRALPDYVRTRGVLHEGGRYEVVSETIPDTRDEMGFLGYWIEKRPLELVSPLVDHDVLGSNEPHFVETTVAYSDFVPSVEAILTHAVPVTSHPFRDAWPYLRLYDVRWSDIPWRVWKVKFPQAEAVTTAPPPDEIAPAPYNPDIPGESLQKEYTLPFQPGLAARHWLAQQRDGGGLVAKLILTKASQSGLVPPPNPVEIPQAPTPAASPDDCLPEGLSFDEFVTKGFYRPPGVCVPLEIIAKERAEIGTKGKTVWGETTEHDLLEEYLKKLREIQGPAPDKPKAVVVPKIETPPPSPAREEVVTLLKDKNRVDEDKATDIRRLVKDFPLVKKLYQDSDGQFVVCQHTLAILDGEMARNLRGFYDAWCAISEGTRVCKFCGEAINRDVMSNVDEFDGDGHALTHQEALAAPEFHPGAIRTFAENLQLIRPKFNTADPADDIFFLLLSVLQLLPDEAQLDPILGQVRAFAEFVRKKGLDASAQAIYGVAGVALLMQIHTPFLVPRRSFGRSFSIAGFPRDGDEKDRGILDSLLSALKITFDQFKGSFRGSSAKLLREIFRSTENVRKNLVTAVKLMARPSPAVCKQLNVRNFGDELAESARRYNAAPPVPPEPKSLVPRLPVDTSKPAEIAQAECVPSAKISFWSTETDPVYVQPPVEYRDVAHAGPTSRVLAPVVSATAVWKMPGGTKSRLAGGIPAFAKNLRRTTLAATLSAIQIRWRDAASIAGRLLDLARAHPGIPAALLRELRADLEALDPRADADDLRDAARGIAYAILQAAGGVPALREAWSEILPEDVALKAVLRPAAELDGEVRILITKEREQFKDTLGRRGDVERDLIKQLLDVGLAPYIMTLRDRQKLAEDLEETLRPKDVLEERPEVPEEGFPAVPKDTEQNDPDEGEAGDYGDAANRPYEGNDVYGN